MKIDLYFKSIIEQDECAVVICNLEHEIIYMNPAAVKNYEKYGGAAIIGHSIFDCHNTKSCEMIQQVVDWFLQAPSNNKVHTGYNEKKNRDVYIVALRDGERLIGYYEKHEYRDRDRNGFYIMEE